MLACSSAVIHTRCCADDHPIGMSLWPVIIELSVRASMTWTVLVGSMLVASHICLLISLVNTFGASANSIRQHSWCVALTDIRSILLGFRL